MEKNIVTKGCTLAFLLLFIGSSIMPNMNGNILALSNLEEKHEMIENINNYDRVFMINSGPLPLGTSCISTEQQTTREKTIITVFKNKNNLKNLLTQGFDIASYKKDTYIDIVATEEEIIQIQNMGYTILQNPKTTIDLFGKTNNQPIDAPAYHTYETMENELLEIATNNPAIANLSIIGTTWEGNSIYAMKISDNVTIDEDETEFLFTGNHHAREIMTVEIPLYIIQYLVNNYSTDPQVTEVVNNNELWFIPMVNPDGHIYVETVDDMWRKNRRDNGDGTFGVDLNRNYGYKWGFDEWGSSSNTSYYDYRGPSPFSEPETIAIKNLAVSHNFLLAIDYHSCGQYFLYPYSYFPKYTEDQDKYDQIASIIEPLLPGYVSGIPHYLLYCANGVSMDWYYGEQSIKNKTFGAAFEVNTQEEGCFHPDPNLIKPTCQKHLTVFFALIDNKNILTMEPYICGDMNMDDFIDISDLLWLIDYMFVSGPAPVPDLCVADISGDGAVDISDLVWIIDYMFNSGPAPIEDCCD